MRKIPADKQGNLQRISEILPKYCAGRLCALDEKIFDPLCLLTGGKCGKNMVFKTVYRTLRMGMSSMLSLTFCIQQCTCVNKYVKKDGQCIKQNSFPVRNETEFRAEILPKRCTGRECALDEEISDVSCSLTGKMCGTNMIFDKVGKSNETNVPCSLTGKICGTNVIFDKVSKSYGTNGTKICVQRCTYLDEEYIKAIGQCILPAKGKKTTTPILTQRSAAEYPQLPLLETRANCEGRSCEIREPLCTLTSRKCGHNMVYKTSERLIYIDGHLEICFQQCKCISEEYIEKDGRCIKKERKENETQVT
ncbi:unnamed protein product [Dracunculus medinensis]|uniref:CTCK domain-containing protein n=1 Tax=Dracunculus medinensis TaxID=318479 RepID=A0A0N4URJ1_DRAME|nr:unnamed protein product [Dracunculus medinensis]